jgi:malonate-semialdehyde dehydrogenase (acetylating)/methylmalonate-semialdehyde dehydrogenase
VPEGAKLVLDGRGVSVSGFEDGFYLGPCIFDDVKPGMSVGDEEIFGPVLSVKRVNDFQEWFRDLYRERPFAREFARRSHAGMVGVNVGIPVPAGVFPFTGHKNPFFGELHTLGKEGIRFHTESKCGTTTWFDREERKRKKVDAWDGVLDVNGKDTA